MDDELTYESRGDVGIITLNRPDARNALTHTTYRLLEEAVRTTAARCLVITGADPAFCSGDDVKQVMVAAGESVSAGLRSDPRITLFRTEDHKEGVAAFLEKREPRFTGR